MKTALGTYPKPKYGWTCFHCGETFRTIGAARDHFGETPDKMTGCQIKAGDELGLLMELRKAESQIAALQQRAMDVEAKAEQSEYELSGWTAIYPSIHALRMHLDAMQGRMVTADALIEGFRQQDPQRFAEVIG